MTNGRMSFSKMIWMGLTIKSLYCRFSFVAITVASKLTGIKKMASKEKENFSSCFEDVDTFPKTTKTGA
jgi:hypothetical protein